MPYKDPDKKKQWEREHRGAGKRHKVWMCVFYEDSSPDWREGIEQAGVASCVSPVHNRDKWTPKDERKNPKHVAGTSKVDHRHKLDEFENPISYQEYVDYLNECGIKSTNIKWCRSKRGMARYLTHMDSKDKARYDDGEVLEFCGACWREWVETSEDDHSMMMDMREFIVANEITDYWAFAFWCDQNNEEWSRLLDRKSYGIERFVGSVRAWVKAGKPEQTWLANVNGAPGDEGSQASESQGAESQGQGEPVQDSPGGGLSATLPPGGADPRPSDPTDPVATKTGSGVEGCNPSPGVEGAERPSNSRSELVCEVCGKPATGGCIGPDGQHLYCEEHAELYYDDGDLFDEPGVGGESA